ncbi:MAG TPA: hypothetical protein P5181_06650 [Dermatophilaceae bacterium]|nr:hypothetical protein [Dermatophilaceae bacterium]
MTEYAVDIPTLSSHARAVAGHASGVRTAADAAATTIDGSAFGVLCAGLAVPAGLVTAAMTLAIRGLADELEQTAADVGTMARRYADAEDVAVSGYRSARRDVRTSLGPQ